MTENTISTEFRPPKFSTKLKIYWGLCSLGTAIVSSIFAALLPIFYTDYLGLVENAEIISTVALIYAIWNAFNDPLFGFLSDSSKSDKGRRIPFMRYTAPFLALSFALVWFAPQGSEIAIFWWMLITMLLYDTAYTIIGIVYSALLPEVTENEEERNSLQLSSSFFYLIGTIIGFLVPDMFRNSPGGFLPLQMAMIAVGVVAGTLIMLTTYKIKERPEFTKVDEPLGLMDSIKYTFKSKAFLILTAANFMSILMQALILGSLYYLADYVVGQATILLLICVFVPLILGIWITPSMIKKFGVVRSNQILLFIGGIGLLSIMFMPPTGIYFSLLLGGLGLVGPLQLTNVLYAQVSDEDELNSGVRREAAFFGTNALLTKPAQSIALAVPALLLAAGNFVPRIDNVIQIQPIEAIIAIRIFVGLIPGIALLLEVLILHYYPLKGEYLKEVQEKILVLHGEKQEKLKQLEKR